MANFEQLDTPTWIEPHFYIPHDDLENGICAKLYPLQYEDDGKQVKLKIYSNGDPFIEFCKEPDFSNFVLDDISYNLEFVRGGEIQHGLAIEIDDFIKHFNDKSIYINDGDFVTKSTLKAINKHARNWRTAGAKYIVISEA